MTTKHDPYASEEETKALLAPDTRTAAEQKLAAMMAERGADEQGAEAYLILRQIAVELLDEGRVEVCCGKYADCLKACTPRGKWLAEQPVDGATLAGLHASIGILSRLVDQQHQLLVEVEDVCGRDGHGGRLEDGESELIDRVRAHIETIAPGTHPRHPDDQAVDRFAAAMKDKLAKAREKGRSGWETCRPEELSRMLREHVEKGDPRDVANFAMMLWNLSAGIAAAPQPAQPQQEQQEPVARPIETNNQVEGLAKQCGWDNRRYMTPADYQIWCDRMRQFVQLASPQPAPVQQEPVAWPCVIKEADFEQNTVTLQMPNQNFWVSTGVYQLSPPSQPTNKG